MMHTRFLCHKLRQKIRENWSLESGCAHFRGILAAPPLLALLELALRASLDCRSCRV